VVKESSWRRDEGNAIRSNLFIVERMPIGDEVMHPMARAIAKKKQSVQGRCTDEKRDVQQDGERTHRKHEGGTMGDAVSEARSDAMSDKRGDDTSDAMELMRAQASASAATSTTSTTSTINTGVVTSSATDVRSVESASASASATNVESAVVDGVIHRQLLALHASTAASPSKTPPSPARCTPTARYAGYKSYTSQSPPPPNKTLRLTVVHLNRKGKKEEKPVLLPAAERTVRGLLAATRKKFRIPPKKEVQAQTAKGKLLTDSDLAGGMNDGTKVLVVFHAS
jgi:hypothetical protein